MRGHLCSRSPELSRCLKQFAPCDQACIVFRISCTNGSSPLKLRHYSPSLFPSQIGQKFQCSNPLVCCCSFPGLLAVFWSRRVMTGTLVTDLWLVWMPTGLHSLSWTLLEDECWSKWSCNLIGRSRRVHDKVWNFLNSCYQQTLRMWRKQRAKKKAGTKKGDT